MVKLGTEFTNTKLCNMIGEFRDQRTSNIYRFTIGLLDAKAESFVYGPYCMEQWAEYFPDFAVMIEGKLADEAYSRLLFDNFRIVETCQPGSGPAEDRPGHNVMSVYSGYTKHHGLKILTVTLPKELTGALYDAISKRKNDNVALNLSNLNVDMMRLQPDVIQARQNGEDMLYYSIYGDAIFPLLNCITGCHRKALQGELTEREEAENASMCWVHISAERPNEMATNFFHILES